MPLGASAVCILLRSKLLSAHSLTVQHIAYEVALSEGAIDRPTVQEWAVGRLVAGP